MRKSSKAISLLLSGLMATSCFGMAAASASAVTVDSEATGATTLAQRQAAGHQLVLFEYPDSVWGDYTNVKYNARKQTAAVFCNFYAIYGNTNEVKTRAWEAPSTTMLADASKSKVFYFDITESGQGEVEPGAEYGILFSTKTNAGQADLLQPNTDGFQTCDLYFNYDCLGETFYVDEPAVVRENTANSQKIDYYGHSSNGISKPIKKVSTLCAYIDGIEPGNTPKSNELANALQTYLPNPTNEPSFTWKKIEPLLSKFGTTAQEVYDRYVEKFSDKIAEATPYEPAGDGKDLKDDGTLKDVYRYSYIITQETDETTGVVTDVTTKYPDFDLVRERLNLPAETPVQDIDEVTVDFDGAVVAGGEAVPEVAAPADANYTVETAWAPADETFGYETEYALTVTYKANDGYDFTADTAYDKLTGLGEGSVDYTTAETYVDGNLVVTYTFTTGEEPAPEDTFIVAGDPAEIFGTAWDAANEDNLMTKNADGNYEITYTVTKAYDSVQLKVVKNGADWIGDDTGNNITFNLTGAGEFTVTIDPETEEITVTGDIVEFVDDILIESVFAVGNGEGWWLNGASWDPGYIGNEMTEVADGIFEISFENVPDGFERQIKFAVDGAWTHNFGGAFEDSGVETDAVYNGDNITFDTDDICTVKVQLDVTNFDFKTKEGAKFTLTITYDEPITTEEPTTEEPTTEEPTTEEPTTEEPKPQPDGIYGDVNGDGEVTVDDATLIQQRGIELVTFDATQEILADVNGDGRVSILDVTCIQKYIAEMTSGTGVTGQEYFAAK